MKDAGPPRFVPILTEVVKSKSPGAAESDPAALAPPASIPAPASERAAAAPPTVPEDELARRVLERVLLELEPLVLDALRTVQVQQARTLEVMVRAELATRVARLVSESLVARSRDCGSPWNSLSPLRFPGSIRRLQLLRVPPQKAPHLFTPWRNLA
jgi:hypothetical protein